MWNMFAISTMNKDAIAYFFKANQTGQTSLINVLLHGKIDNIRENLAAILKILCSSSAHT